MNAQKQHKLYNCEGAANIIRDAGGQIVGRTRLQKIGYLLELAGFGEGFSFSYHHFGPFSEQLVDTIDIAILFDLVDEEERSTEWGGTYSIYTAPGTPRGSQARREFISALKDEDSIVLELTATAAFLSNDPFVKDPWMETARRKPEKSDQKRLEKAKDLYRRLLGLETQFPLPRIV